jgi:hypothetical protein
LSKTQKRK